MNFKICLALLGVAIATTFIGVGTEYLLLVWIGASLLFLVFLIEYIIYRVKLKIIQNKCKKLNQK